MSLPRAKREFIKELVAAIDETMHISQLATHIGICPRNEIEVFIKDHFLVQADDGTYRVNTQAFRTGIDLLEFDNLCEVLIHLDRLGITLRAVCKQSEITGFASLKTFKDLILF